MFELLKSLFKMPQPSGPPRQMAAFTVSNPTITQGIIVPEGDVWCADCTESPAAAQSPPAVLYRRGDFAHGLSVSKSLYAEGVAFLSPGSRSAPWVGGETSNDTPKGFHNVCRGKRLKPWNPVGVPLSYRFVTQGALRDPGLENTTPSG